MASVGNFSPLAAPVALLQRQFTQIHAGIKRHFCICDEMVDLNFPECSCWGFSSSALLCAEKHGLDYRRFGGTCRLRVHSSLLLVVGTPEDIELQTIECQRHKMSNIRESSAAGRYLSYIRIPSNVIHSSSWKSSRSSRPGVNYRVFHGRTDGVAGLSNRVRHNVTLLTC